MAIVYQVQERRVQVGTLLSGTFSELNVIRRELAIYLAVFAAAALLADLAEVIRGPIALATTIGYFIGQYLLYQAMLRKAGMLRDERKKVFSFFVMALLLAIPIYIGAAFLLIPGIILGAKWIMAPTYLVAREGNLFHAIGESWKASEFNTVNLSLAYFLIWLLWLILASIISGGDSAVRGGQDPSVLTWIAFHLLPVLMMGLSMTAFRHLNDETETLAGVFQ